LNWILNQIWLWEWLYSYSTKIMSAYFLVNLSWYANYSTKKILTKWSHLYISTIELESFVYYIILSLINYKIRFYYFIMFCLFWIFRENTKNIAFRFIVYFELRIDLICIRIQATSTPYLYSIILLWKYENGYEKDTIWSAFDLFLPLPPIKCFYF
jgi:hypothetical protein